MKNFDAVIIGFGKAGKTLAGELAKAGKKLRWWNSQALNAFSHRYPK